MPPRSEYLNPKGIIPPHCVLHKGETKKDSDPGEKGEASAPGGEEDEDEAELLKGNQAELEG